jgi:hypothetical protein
MQGKDPSQARVCLAKREPQLLRGVVMCGDPTSLAKGQTAVVLTNVGLVWEP